MLRAALKRSGWDLLILMGPAPVPPKSVRCQYKANAVTISVGPRDGDERSSRPVGLWMSPTETLIVDKVRAFKAHTPATKLFGPQISKLTSIPYENYLKALLRNLVDRQILALDGGEGYSLPQDGAPPS